MNNFFSSQSSKLSNFTNVELPILALDQLSWKQLTDWVQLAIKLHVAKNNRCGSQLNCKEPPFQPHPQKGLSSQSKGRIIILPVTETDNEAVEMVLIVHSFKIHKNDISKTQNLIHVSTQFFKIISENVGSYYQ